MIWKRPIVAALTVLLLILISSTFSYTQALAAGKLEIEATIPIMQSLVIAEPVEVNFIDPWPGSESGQALEFNGVGKIFVQSNCTWSLSVNALASRGYTVAVKPSTDPGAQWSSLNARPAVFGGRRGASEMSWDILIQKEAGFSRDSGEKTVRLIFTLSHS